MTIIVQRVGDDLLKVISGQRQLQATLDVHGKATVVVADTHEALEVHAVDGEIFVLTSPAAAAAETIAAQAIARAGR